jgi:hypothetical protein
MMTGDEARWGNVSAKNRCNPGLGFDQYLTATPFSRVAGTGNFGAELASMTGKFAGLGFFDL